MQVFKVNRYFSLFLMLIAGIGLLAMRLFYPASPVDETDTIKLVFYGFQALIFGLGLYTLMSIRLSISAAGVQLSDRWFNAISFELSWSEIELVYKAKNPMNQQAIFFFYNSESKVLKQINPHFFEPVAGRQYLEPVSLKQRFLGIKQLPAVERAIIQYAAKVEDTRLSDMRGLYKNSSADLGKQAQSLAVLSVVMFCLGMVFLLWGDSKHLLGGSAVYWIGGFTLVFFLVALSWLPEKNVSANIIVAALFSGCAMWLLVQGGHFYTLQKTPVLLVDYSLVVTKTESQIWQAEGFPDIKVHADPGNLVYEELGTQQIIELHSGPLQLYDVPREQVNRLLKIPQGLKTPVD